MRRPRLTASRVATLDFESDVIKRRPLYPPEPKSFAIRLPSEKKSRAFTFGHPSKNNCTWEQAKAVIRNLWAAVKRGDIDGILFQNGKFDIDIAEVFFGVPRLHWSKYHELQFLLFFNDPHSPNLQLKPQAQRLLNIPAGEKDEATEWLKAHYGAGKGKLPDPRPFIEGREPGNHPKPERVKWYAMAGLLPGDLAGRLACGDVDRTEKLFNLLYPLIIEQGMSDAYDRRRKFMLIALDNEREGVHVDLDLLQSDVTMYEQAMRDCEAWLRKRLKAPTLNFNSDEDFAESLAKNKLVDDDKWVWTKGRKDGTGKKRSVSKKNLTPDMVNDKKVAQMYGYRNRLFTCLSIFMKPWLRQATATFEASGTATIHTNWKLVKASDFGGGDSGAATGRLSSSPNFQNISKDMEDKGDGYVHPEWSGLPNLPKCRKYLLPDKGHVWGRRDYDGQELRIFAHFDPSGETLDNYLAIPDFKIHKIIHKALNEDLGWSKTYQQVKNFDFQVLYGGGRPAVAAALDCSIDEAAQAIAKVREYIPGYGLINDDMKRRAKNKLPPYDKRGEPYTCWGGRVYHCEPPRFSEEEGRWKTFDYKMLNYLIQGSAADCTIEAVIRYMEHPKRQSRFLLCVHDEIDISMPAHRVKEEMAILRECMESVGLTGTYGKWVKPAPENFDVPMLSDGECGPRWSDLTHESEYPPKPTKPTAKKGKVIQMKKPVKQVRKKAA